MAKPASRSLFAASCLVLLAAFALPAQAQKPPQQIREYLMSDPEQSIASVNSVEPFHAEAIDDLLVAGVWKVAYTSERSQGESTIFMAVHEDAVLRLHRFDQPRSRESFVRLIRPDFRVRSEADARKVVAAALALHFGFPFSEPEMSAEEMRMEKRGNDYFFIDGERFGDPTGYRLTVDGDGRVMEFEYSWELPVATSGG